MNKFKKVIIIIIILVLGKGIIAQAKSNVDVEFPVRTNLTGKIFGEKNIYPGWSKSKLIRVGNRSNDDSVDLYITFDAKGDKTLAKELKVYVIRQKDGSYRLGGTGDHWTLKEADEKRFFIDRLNPEEKRQYKIKIKFSEKAGNEYQGLRAKFDLDFRIEQQPSGNQSPQQILAQQGRRTFTGQAPQGENINQEQGGNEGQTAEEENKSEVKGAEEGGNNPQVGGAMTGVCHQWSWWVWALAALAYGGALHLGIKRV